MMYILARSSGGTPILKTLPATLVAFALAGPPALATNVRQDLGSSEANSVGNQESFSAIFDQVISKVGFGWPEGAGQTNQGVITATSLAPPVRDQSGENASKKAEDGPEQRNENVTDETPSFLGHVDKLRTQSRAARI